MALGLLGSRIRSPTLRSKVVEGPLQEREVVGLILSCVIPKALKMVPVATLHGAQHYKASTGSSLTHYQGSESE